LASNRRKSRRFAANAGAASRSALPALIESSAFVLLKRRGNRATLGCFPTAGSRMPGKSRYCHDIGRASG